MRKRTLKVGIGLVLVVVAGMVALLLTGLYLLYSERSCLRSIGRITLKAKTGLGMAGSDDLLLATDAAIAQSVGPEREQTLAIIHCGVHEMSPEAKRDFMRGIERRLLEASSYEHSAALVIEWGKELSLDAMKKALTSENPNSRFGVYWAIYEKVGPELSRRHIRELVDFAYAEGQKSGDTRRVSRVLALVYYRNLLGFIEDNRTSIRKSLDSSDPPLRKMARACLGKLKAASTMPDRGDTGTMGSERR